MKTDIISAEDAKTLDNLFKIRCDRTPKGIAYRSYERNNKAWNDMSWEEALANAGRWQKSLEKENLDPGERVAILMKNCTQWVCCDMASLGLEMVVVPLYMDDRPENVAHMMADSGAKILLVQDHRQWIKMAEALLPLASLQRIIIVDSDKTYDNPRIVHLRDWLVASGEYQACGQNKDQLASIVYTSGTTGKPKGVMLSHWNMLSIAYACARLVPLTSDDLVLSFLPLSHTLERTGGYYLPIMTGSTIAYSRSVQQLADDLVTLKPTAMVAVPRIFERVYTRMQQQLKKKPSIQQKIFHLAVKVGWQIAERKQGRGQWTAVQLLWPGLRKAVAEPFLQKLGGQLRVAISGGAALSPEVAKTFISLGLPLLQGYGLTETSPVICLNTIEGNDPNTVGKFLPGIDFKLTEEQELLVKTPGMMQGYWNNQKATDQIIDKDGWLHTGDQVNIEAGRVTITGRIKDIVVLSNGEKLPPADMEMAITLDPLFEQAMVIGEGKPFMSALLVLEAGEWQIFCAENNLNAEDERLLSDKKVHKKMIHRVSDLLHAFPGYAKIRKVVLTLNAWSVDNGLMTPTLKIKRNKVVAQYAPEVTAIYEE